MSAVWYRLHDEPNDKYFYFQMYRNAPADERRAMIDTIAAKSGVNERTVRDWAVRYNWKERAAAHDIEQDRRFLEDNFQWFSELRKDILAQEGELLHKVGAHLEKMVGRLPQLLVDSEQMVPDANDPDKEVKLLTRRLNTQQLQQLMRAINQYTVMIRRRGLLPTNTSAKYLEDATLDLGKDRRVVKIERMYLDDAGGFESQVGRVEVSDMPQPQLVEGEVVDIERKDAG